MALPLLLARKQVSSDNIVEQGICDITSSFLVFSI